jgi:hypothetical protein
MRKHCECTGCKGPTPPLPLVDNRPLHDRQLYKKLGNDYYLRALDKWFLSLKGD